MSMMMWVPKSREAEDGGGGPPLPCLGRGLAAGAPSPRRNYPCCNGFLEGGPVDIEVKTDTILKWSLLNAYYTLAGMTRHVCLDLLGCSMIA